MSKKNLRVEIPKNNHITGLYNLSFVFKNDQVLMMRRANEPNPGKLNGLGGKIEHSELISSSMIRELREEAGITPLQYHLSCLLRCSNRDSQKDYMIFCYAIHAFEGQIFDATEEGQLEWIDLRQINTKNVDLVDNIPYFLPHIINHQPLLEMSFVYEGTPLICSFRGEQAEQSWQGNYTVLE